MMIAGFAEVDEGGIWVDGQDVSALAPQRRGFGMVFQNYAIFPHLNVFENVAFPLRARRVRDDEIKQRVQAALELVRLERFADRFSRQLSGGQQQRVAIARAIAKNPEILMCDEPTGALDCATGIRVLEALTQVNRAIGATTLVITHNAAIREIADRTLRFADGRIVEETANASRKSPGEISW
jgi:ABC-type Fe3+/spermidine/putrescine transport system ATPase subunit